LKLSQGFVKPYNVHKEYARSKASPSAANKIFSTDLMRRAAGKILKVFRRLLVSLRNTFNNKSPIRMRIGHLMFLNEHARSAHAHLENSEPQL
jgi:hypothetical protein